MNPNKKKVSKNSPDFNLGKELHRLAGVDLLAVPGINNVSALQLLGEIGFDMTRWKSPKQFSSWLGLCPGNKVSGGKTLSVKKTHLIIGRLLPYAWQPLHYIVAQLLLGLI